MNCSGRPAAPVFKQEPRKKFSYIGAPACFKLSFACTIVNKALGGSCYQVGSSLERPDFRDVDVRCIMSDESFNALFGDTKGAWELTPLWILMTASISTWLSEQTGLPIDFQIQPQTHANERHKGTRNAIGHYAFVDDPAWRESDL